MLKHSVSVSPMHIRYSGSAWSRQEWCQDKVSGALVTCKTKSYVVILRGMQKVALVPIWNCYQNSNFTVTNNTILASGK